LPDGFLQPALQKQGVSQVATGIHVVRIVKQGLPKVPDCDVRFSVHGQPQAEDVVSVGVISPGSPRQRVRVVSGRIGRIEAGQRLVQIVERTLVTGFNINGLEQIIYRFVHPLFVQTGPAKTVQGDVIVCREVNGVAKKCFTIPPIVQLRARSRRTSSQNQQDSERNNQAGRSPARDHLSGRPYSNPKHTQQGDVSVAIRHGLVSSLGQPNYGNHRSQKPQPSHQTIRSPPYCSNRQNGQPDQQHGRRENLIPWPVPGKRIGDDKFGRPESFRQITRVGNQGICDSCAQRSDGQRLNGVAVKLSGKGQHRSDGGEQEERDFLAHQPEQRRAAVKKVLRFDAPQRPIVQQQQRERQGYQHGFTHQTQRKKSQGRKILSGPGHRTGGPSGRNLGG